MTYLLNKRRATALALVAMLLAVAGTLVGARMARASSYPCSDQPTDYTVYGGGSGVYAGADYRGGTGGWVCASATGESNQQFVGFMAHDPNPGTPGGAVALYSCANVPTSGDYWIPGCKYLVAPVGAEVGAPSTSTNQPAGGAAGTGGSVGIGSGTCVWANSATPTICPGGVYIAGVTANEADLVPTVTPSTPSGPPCTGINNTCLPVGATVRVGQDTANPTLKLDTAATGSVPADIGPQCVQVNATC